MDLSRRPSDQEKQLISFLIRKSTRDIQDGFEDILIVQPMEDGGMGSLKLIPFGLLPDDRMFGQVISEFEFKDVDNVLVVASLIVDTNGCLLELDVWKTDFSPLISFPQFK